MSAKVSHAEQLAHLNEGTCQCHDSWDQCPCAEGGHFPGCNCCPLGTGLCGPKPEHRGPNPPDTPTAGESGQAATGATSAPVAADIAADYPWLVEFKGTASWVEELPRALAEIEAGRNAIAANRLLRADLRIKHRNIARLEAELADARQHEAHWRKEADSWKESVDNLTRQVDDLKDAIDTADTVVTAAFATLKGYAL